MKTKKILPLVILGSMLIPNACFGMQQPTWEQRAEGAFQKIAVLGTGLAALYTYYMTRPSKKMSSGSRYSTIEEGGADFKSVTGFDESYLKNYHLYDWDIYYYNNLAQGLKNVRKIDTISDEERKEFSNMIVDTALLSYVNNYHSIKAKDIADIQNNNKLPIIKHELDYRMKTALNRKLWQAALQRLEEAKIYGVD
jgi:hypothetical protein